MFHIEDIVEEIATRRQGQIDSIQSEGVSGQEQIPTRWHVVFSDGKQPTSKDFTSESGLKMITCPHCPSGPSLYPADPIQDPPF